MARLLAMAPRLDVEQAAALADACRRAGALEDAERLIERLRQQASAAPEAALRLGEALQGRDLLRASTAAGPTPIVRRKDFLPPELHAQILEDLQRCLDEFVASPLLAGDQEIYAADRRRSLTRRALGAYRAELEQHLQTLLLDIPDVAALMNDPAVRLDLHCQVHGDGDFFGVHSDAEAGRWGQRLVSLVYYLHSRPRRFSGGDLLIYDRRIGGDTYNESAFTRVIPDDNSLVVFPATAVHEVERLQMPDAPLAHGRFTIVGALLAKS